MLFPTSISFSVNGFYDTGMDAVKASVAIFFIYGKYRVRGLSMIPLRMAN